MSGNQDDCVLVLARRAPLPSRLLLRLAEAGYRVAFIQAPAEAGSSHGDEALANIPPDRIWRLEGDPTSIDFGLSGAEYRQLARRCTQVVHCFESRAEPRTMESSDLVRSAAELVEFVAAGGGARGVVCLSSFFVFGSHSGKVEEDSLHLGQSFPSLYQESLAVREKVLRQVADRVPLSVLRTWPRSGTLAPPEVFSLGPLGELARSVQLAPDLLDASLTERPFFLESEERVLDVLVHLTRIRQSGTYHLVDSTAPSLRTVVHWLARHFGKELLDNPRAGRSRLVGRRTKSLGGRMIQGLPWQVKRDAAERFLHAHLDHDPLQWLELWYPLTNANAEPKADAKAHSSSDGESPERRSG